MRKQLKSRCKRIEEYLNLLSEHLIARSTPYFEEALEIPMESIVAWINYHDGFEGVRRLQNRHIRLNQDGEAVNETYLNDKFEKSNCLCSDNLNAFIQIKSKIILLSLNNTMLKFHLR